MSGYRIVEFSEEVGKPVEAVPASWLVEQDQVKWPSVGTAKLTSLIKKCSIPQDHPNIEWKVVKCRILYSVDDYRMARKAALRATVSTDIELTDSESLLQNESRVLRWQAPPAKFEATEASSSNNEEAAGGIVEIEGPGTHENIFTLEIPSSSPAPIVNQLSERPAHTDIILRELQTEFRGFQDIVLEKLVKITKELDPVSQVVGRMSVSSVQHEGLDLPNGLEFPIKDARGFSSLQQWMQSKPNQSNLVSFLKGIGGSNWKDCTRRILDRVISSELGKYINLSGANGKIAFRSHLLRSCIISSLRNAESPDSPTEKEVDEYFVRYFGGANDRNGGRAARQKNPVQD